MPETPDERRRREQELAQRRQGEALERARFQRTLCTGCGLMRASVGAVCSMCAPRPDSTSRFQDLFESSVPQQQVCDDDFEQDRIFEALEEQRFRRTLCTGCGLMKATMGGVCSLCACADSSPDSFEEVSLLDLVAAEQVGVTRRVFEDERQQDADARMQALWDVEADEACAFHGTVADGGLCDLCEEKLSSMSCPVNLVDRGADEAEAYLLTDYGRVNIESRRGDGLDGDEFLLHAWLKAHGLTDDDRDRYNGVLLLPEDQHRVLSAVQSEFGLHDADFLRQCSITDIMVMNLKCLEIVGIKEGLRARVLEQALEQVPSLISRGVPY